MNGKCDECGCTLQDKTDLQRALINGKYKKNEKSWKINHVIHKTVEIVTNAYWDNGKLPPKSTRWLKIVRYFKFILNHWFLCRWTAPVIYWYAFSRETCLRTCILVIFLRVWCHLRWAYTWYLHAHYCGCAIRGNRKEKLEILNLLALLRWRRIFRAKSEEKLCEQRWICMGFAI